MKKIILSLIGVFLFVCAYSQNDSTNLDNLFDLSLEELMDIEVVSVSKSSESVLQAPQTIIVITEEEIKRRGYIDLEQLLHDLPGFDISRGNGTQYSQIYQRGYRSKNTERTSFQIDGVEENDIWSNSVWLSRQYPLSNVKRVEIIYGPASTVYGANAFLGVINIVTKNAKDIIPKDKHVGVEAQASYGSWNTWYTDVSVAGKVKNVSLMVTGRVYQSDEMDLSGYDDWDYDLSGYDLAFYKDVLGTENDDIALRAMELDNNMYYNDPELNGKLPTYSNFTNDWLINSKL